ncbi:DUF1622 domain-containing protein [Flavobacterium sp. N3904]|uniref:DUF1622 domain-containing protein n=1 Tax=Flavobacterium sp. N3904 TaxID=2986835 RepID=UPI002224059E|nr:DUF1622 domain-containing protein [Flavobacterium sp. N3904]
MEEIIKISTQTIAQFIEFLSAIIIAYSSLKAVIQYFKDSFSKAAGYLPDTNIRLSLGKSLAIALELLLGADILKTAIAPTWTEIGQLAAIATLRTALNYFLERELKESKEKQNEK